MDLKEDGYFIYSTNDKKQLFTLTGEGLEQEKLKIPNGIEIIDSFAFSNSKKIKSVEFSDTVIEICQGAFFYCNSLEKIKFSKSLKIIGKYAFVDCVNLKAIKLPETVQHMGVNVFKNCHSLKHIKLPENIEFIPSSMFRGCTSLEYVVIPKKIKTIQKGAFAQCDNLSKIYYQGSINEWKNIEIFEDNNILNKVEIIPHNLDYQKMIMF